MYKIIAATLLVMVTTSSFAGEVVPRFSDYPAKKIFKGKNANVKKAPDDAVDYRRALVVRSM